MKAHWLVFAMTAFVLLMPYPTNGVNIWTDILTCVNGLANSTDLDMLNITNSTSQPASEPIKEEFSMMKLLSIICGDKDGFVQCLDSSLKHSNDSVTQIIGSFFEPLMVTQAYDGLCANISAIEKTGVNAMSCLSKVKTSPCQNEVADYFFYMGVVKKFAPPTEQLSRNTMETLLCSVTFQRRKCEVRALRQCSESLADVMDEFYTQTQPASCAELQKEHASDTENAVEQ